MNVYVNAEKKAGLYEHQHGHNSFIWGRLGKRWDLPGIVLMLYTSVYMTKPQNQTKQKRKPKAKVMVQNEIDFWNYCIPVDKNQGIYLQSCP